MTSIIAFTVVSKDDFWQEKASQLKDHLRSHNIELVICSLDDPPSTSLDDRSRYYYLKDSNFIEFARQEQRRRIWLIDAEVRLVRPLPKEWIESNKSVIFYHDINTRSDEDRIVNVGHCIFDRPFVKLYKQAIELAQAAKNSGNETYDIERHIHKIPFPNHIKTVICMDRRKATPDCKSTASRGSFVSDHTILTHPYDHNFKLRPKSLPALTADMDIDSFYNHFSPHDITIAHTVCDLLLKGNDDHAFWSKLDIDRFDNGLHMATLGSMLPQEMNHRVFMLPFLCYSLLGWIFCPRLQLLAPKDDWVTRAYKLVDFNQ